MVFLGVVVLSYKMICNNSKNITTTCIANIINLIGSVSIFRACTVSAISSPNFAILQSLFAAYLGVISGLFLKRKLFNNQNEYNGKMLQGHSLWKSHKFLGVAENASDQQISKAYRKAALGSYTQQKI